MKTLLPHLFLRAAIALLVYVTPASVVRGDEQLQVNLPFGHSDEVTGAVFLSSRFIATCSKDATVIVWDVDTGFPVRRIFMEDVCFSMSQRSGSDILEVSCGNVRRGTKRATVNPFSGEVETVDAEIPVVGSVPDEGLVNRLALKADVTLTVQSGDRVVVGYADGVVELWGLGQTGPLLLQKLQSQIVETTSVAASRQWVASWKYGKESGSHQLRFWNPATLEVVQADAGESSSLVSGLFVHDGAFFVSCENKHSAGLWELVVRESATGMVVSRASNRSGLQSILSSVPGTDQFVETQYGLTGPGVSLWEFSRGVLKRLREYPQIEANNAVYDPKRGSIFSADFVVEGEGLLEIHDADNGEPRGIFGQGQAGIFGTAVGMRLYPDTLLLSTFHRAAGYLAVVDLQQQTSQVLDFPGIHSAFSLAAGKRLLLGATEGSIKVSVLDAATGTPLSSWEYPQSNYFREQLVAAAGWTMKKDAVALAEAEDKAYVVEPSGVIRILHLSDAGQLTDGGMLVPLTSGDWSIVTPDGTYASTPGGATKLAFSRDRETFAFERFDLAFNRPDKVVEAFGGDTGTISNLRKAYSEREQQYAETRSYGNIRVPFEAAPKIQNREAIGGVTAATTITLNVAAEHPAGEGSVLSVVVNGVPRSSPPIRPDGTPFSVEVPLVRGTNRIEVAAVSPDGSSSLPETLRVYRETGSTLPDLYLLTVGVSDYLNDELDLGVAAKDAGDVAGLFSKQKGRAFAEVHVRTLLNTDATKENIMAAKDFLSAATSNDSVIVFLAGHGALESETLKYYFGTPDIDVKDITQRGLAYDEIERLIAGCGAGSKLLLLDTCFAGEVEGFDVAETAAFREQLPPQVTARAFALSVAPARRHGSMAGLRHELFADLRRNSGANVITASGGMEFVFALEANEVGNGLFTHSLIEGIESGASDGNGDGEVTVSELYDGLSISLRALSGGSQLPSLREVNRYSDLSVAQCRSYSKLDEVALLENLIEMTTGYEREAEYASLFSPQCNYFGNRLSRSEIENEERKYHQQYDARDILLTGLPRAVLLPDGAFSVNYQARLYLMNTSENTATPVARFGARELLEQDLELRVEYVGRQWLITSIEVKDSKRMSNPDYKEVR